MRLRAAEELFFSDVEYHSWVEQTSSEGSPNDVLVPNELDRPNLTATPPMRSPSTNYLTHKTSSIGDSVHGVEPLKVRASDARNNSSLTAPLRSYRSFHKGNRSRSNSRGSLVSQSSDATSHTSSHSSRTPIACSSSSSHGTVRLIRRKSTLPQVQFRRASATTTRRKRPASAPSGNSDVARKIRAFERLSIRAEKPRSLAGGKTGGSIAELRHSGFFKHRESQQLYERRCMGSCSLGEKHVSVEVVTDQRQSMLTHLYAVSADATATSAYFHNYNISTPSSILPTPTAFYLPIRTPSPRSNSIGFFQPVQPPESWPLPSAGLPPIAEHLQLNSIQSPLTTTPHPINNKPLPPLTSHPHHRKPSSQHPYPFPTNIPDPARPTLLRLTSGTLLTVSSPSPNPWQRTLYLHGPTPIPPKISTAAALHRASVVATLELWDAGASGLQEAGSVVEEEIVEFFEGMLGGVRNGQVGKGWM